jgi:hypothetical protein
MNYSNTLLTKLCCLEVMIRLHQPQQLAGLWQSTSAINTVKILGFGGNNLDAGSTFTLYGIKAE